MTGSGFTEKQYQRNKEAHDRLQNDLVKHGGMKPDQAKKIADKTAHETDNKRKQERQNG